MALLTQVKSRGCVRSCLSMTSRTLRSAPVAPPPRTLSSKLAMFLYRYFHDVEQIVSWSSWLKQWTLRSRNAYYGYTEMHHGPNIAAAYYILCMRGRFRFTGQPDWFETNYRGKFSWDFMNYPDSTIEEVDMSRTLVNYSGLDNLVRQPALRTLSLRGCPEVDDWSLSRLHVFQDSLEELDVSHCPQLTLGGVASLHRLRKLRRLDLSSLPRLQSPGLVRILLEEVLPHCHIVGVEYSQGLEETGPDTGLQAESEMDHTYTQGPHRQTLTQ